MEWTVCFDTKLEHSILDRDAVKQRGGEVSGGKQRKLLVKDSALTKEKFPTAYFMITSR